MQNIEQWRDYGLAGATEDETSGPPVEWSYLGLNNWGWMQGPDGRRYSTIENYGMIDGCALSGMSVEVDENDQWEPGTYRTPMLELAVDDYSYLQSNGSPYDGMLGLSDTGEIYAYDGSLGFFRKLFRRAKSAVKKVGRRIKKGIRKVLKKSRFGRFLLKVGGKIKRIAMKVVKPLIKFVGKYAAKLAPIAAIIPGYGTAIAGALMAAGKVANLMTKWGVKLKGKPGTVRGLKMKHPKKFGKFRKALQAEASKMRRMKRRRPRKFRELATSLARKTPLY